MGSKTMGKTVISITAIGTRGDAAGKVFTAKRDSRGKYVLNRKRFSTSCSPTNHAIHSSRRRFAARLDSGTRSFYVRHGFAHRRLRCYR